MMKFKQLRKSSVDHKLLEEKDLEKLRQFSRILLKAQNSKKWGSTFCSSDGTIFEQYDKIYADEKEEDMYTVSSDGKTEYRVRTLEKKRRKQGVVNIPNREFNTNIDKNTDTDNTENNFLDDKSNFVEAPSVLRKNSMKYDVLRNSFRGKGFDDSNGDQDKKGNTEFVRFSDPRKSFRCKESETNKNNSRKNSVRRNSVVQQESDATLDEKFFTPKSEKQVCNERRPHPASANEPSNFSCHKPLREFSTTAVQTVVPPHYYSKDETDRNTNKKEEIKKNSTESPSKTKKISKPNKFISNFCSLISENFGTDIELGEKKTPSNNEFSKVVEKYKENGHASHNNSSNANTIYSLTQHMHSAKSKDNISDDEKAPNIELKASGENNYESVLRYKDCYPEDIHVEILENEMKISGWKNSELEKCNTTNTINLPHNVEYESAEVIFKENDNLQMKLSVFS